MRPPSSTASSVCTRRAASHDLPLSPHERSSLLHVLALSLLDELLLSLHAEGFTDYRSSSRIRRASPLVLRTTPPPARERHECRYGFSISRLCRACVSYWRIVLKKSLWDDDQNCSGPLMPFARGDMGDRIVSNKSDDGALCGRYAVL